MDFPVEQLQVNFPTAWAKWSAYAMKIPFAELKKQDWYKEFFQLQNVEYAPWAVEHSFRQLEINLTQAN